MRVERARGVTLIELVVFIVIVGVAMGALFAVYNTMTARSADPQVRKQALAIAESLLDEVMLMPFTYCDPDDATAATATSAVVPPCTTKAETSATAEGDPSTADSLPAAETRYSLTSPFDNVNDYHGFSMATIKDIAGDDVSGLTGYTASVAVVQQNLGPGTTEDPVISGGPALRIKVTVTAPGNVSVVLEGFRTRYSPNTLP